MAENKKYSGRVGVTNFYYAILDNTDAVEGAPERIKFLQNANVEFSQEISRAYGDNTTAELAVANGPLTVSTQFHNVPQEDQDKIYGAEVSEDGLSSYGGDDNPPYIACALQVTHENGDSSWIGLTKGKFMRSGEENATKEDSVEFASDTTEGEFMDRDVDGYTKPKSYLKGYEESGTTDIRDALFQKVFGAAFPGEPETSPEG